MKAEYDFPKAKRGPVKSLAGKTRITIYLDDDLLEHFRDAATAKGLGYQTVINRTLRAAMADASASTVREPVDASALLVEVRHRRDGEVRGQGGHESGAPSSKQDKSTPNK